MQQGGSSRDGEQKKNLKYILEVEVTGLTKRLGEVSSKKESNMILRGLALVTMWMRVSLSKAEKIGFGMIGNPKCYARFGMSKRQPNGPIKQAFCMSLKHRRKKAGLESLTWELPAFRC